ncbi:nucleotide-diphospho-sugar transferase [Xylogone sp. PMI_703]|nr:nucleotide-diphospho-sugar transferase [Xylogone sp. PMI_703]
MAFMTLTLKKFTGYCIITSLFFTLLCLHYYIKEELLFSAVLDSSFITFDDFDPEYTKALNISISDRTPIQYDAPLSSTIKIPPIIHNIWFAGISRDQSMKTKIPDIWSTAQDMCRDNNPNYTIYTWNADSGREFIEEHYAWFLPTYDGYKFPIQRVDALKYFVLWHYGGVYMDLDISCRRSLDPLLEFSAWFPRASPLGINNDLMASRPGHPVFGRMIQNLRNYDVSYYFTYPTVFWSTGPMFANIMLKDYWFRGNKPVGSRAEEEANITITNDDETCVRELLEGGSRAHRYSCPGDIAILPRIFYSEEYTFFGHRPGGSWHGDDVVVVVWVWERRYAIIGMILISTVGIYATRRIMFQRIKRLQMGAYGKECLV